MTEPVLVPLQAGETAIVLLILVAVLYGGYRFFKWAANKPKDDAQDLLED